MVLLVRYSRVEGGPLYACNHTGLAVLVWVKPGGTRVGMGGSFPAQHLPESLFPLN